MSGSQKCTGCGSPRPLEVEVTTKQGRRMRMVSCPRCETRRWLSEDGSPMTTDAVFQVAAGDPDFELRSASRNASR